MGRVGYCSFVGSADAVNMRVAGYVSRGYVRTGLYVGGDDFGFIMESLNGEDAEEVWQRHKEHKRKIYLYARLRECEVFDVPEIIFRTGKSLEELISESQEGIEA